MPEGPFKAWEIKHVGFEAARLGIIFIYLAPTRGAVPSWCADLAYLEELEFVDRVTVVGYDDDGCARLRVELTTIEEGGVRGFGEGKYLNSDRQAEILEALGHPEVVTA